MSDSTFQLGDIVVPKSYSKAGYNLFMTVHSFTDSTGKAAYDKPSHYVYCQHYYQPTGDFRKVLLHVNELQKAQ